MRSSGRTVVALAVAAAAVLLVCAAGALARGRPPVRSVSNPPGLAGARIVLRVNGSGPLAVFASFDRRRDRHDVRLVRRVRVRRGRISFAVPRSLRAGTYFLLVCPATGRGACVSSKRPTVVIRAMNVHRAAVTAHPVDEAAHAGSAVVGSKGGTVDATGADGTRFHLAVPAGSVPDGTTITMTPVSTLGKAFSGKLIGAVQLAPEGLTLVHGATLTIVPKHPVPLARQVGLGYGGTGSDLHVVPLAPTRAIEVPLAHFSGAGAGNSGGGAAGGPNGTGIVEFYEGLVAQVVADARAHNDDSHWQEPAAKLLEKALDQVLATEVPPGLSDDAAAVKAMHDMLTLVRDLQLVTGFDDFGLVQGKLLKLVQGIYDRAQNTCASKHDLDQVRRLVDLDRTKQLITGVASDTFDQDFKCYRFRVDFDSLVTVHDPQGGGDFHFEYVAHVTIKPTINGADVFDSGQDAGTYSTCSGSGGTGGGGTTTVTVTGCTGDTFDVTRFFLPLHPLKDEATAPPDTSAPLPPPELSIDVHNPVEHYHAVDSSSGYTTDFDDHNWSRVFEIFHNPDPNTGAIKLTPMEAAGGGSELVARGTFSNTTPDGSGIEQTTVDVFHTP